MSKPRLTIGVADHDLNQALITGEVESPDFALDVQAGNEDGERHRRMLHERAFDACEFALGTYLMLRADGGGGLHGIPAFPNRKFRHSYIFVNRRAGIREPRDLAGKRVGLRGWQTTASMWARGVLSRYYGLDLTSVRWLAPPEIMPVSVPAGIVREEVPKSVDWDALLVAGEVDAVIFPDVLPSVQRGDPAVGRLFEDYRAEEQAFYRRTGIFPISHVVVLREEALGAHPEAPLSLLRAFRQARDAAFRRIEEQQILSLSWAGAALAEQRALMGANYWPYNVADNRHVLETAISFAHEQQMIPRPLAVEDLFIPETVSAPGA
jgi:4,5-dihydroxyphthalate decarboxylase